MPRFDHRFARQNGCGPPPEFPLASSYPGIVHHLSGPNIYAQTRIKCYQDRSMVPTMWSHLILSLRARVCHSNTRIHVRLLGPCFKTGRLRPLRQVRPCQVITTKWYCPVCKQRRTNTTNRSQSTVRSIPPRQHRINPNYKTKKIVTFSGSSAASASGLDSHIGYGRD